MKTTRPHLAAGPIHRPDTGPESVGPSSGLALAVPAELIEAIAGRVVELLTDQAEPTATGYLDAEAAAEYLAAPKSRIYELAAAGRVRHYRDGRRLLFKPSDLDELLEVKGIEDR